MKNLQIYENEVANLQKKYYGPTDIDDNESLMIKSIRETNDQVQLYKIPLILMSSGRRVLL